MIVTLMTYQNMMQNGRINGWSHMIVTLMTCVSTLSNALILLAIEIAILSGALTRWWQSSQR